MDKQIGYIDETEWAALERYGDLFQDLGDQLADRWQQSPRLCSWEEFCDHFTNDVFGLLQHYGPVHPDGRPRIRHRRRERAVMDRNAA